MTAYPQMYEIAYSLGLLLAEMKKYEQAAVYLEKAAAGMPERGRVHYNLGLLLQRLGKDIKAEAALLKALKLDDNNINYLHALADFYLKNGQFQKAEIVVQQILSKHPSNRIGHQLMEIIKRRR